MYKKLNILFFALFVSFAVQSQELNCNVEIDASNVQLNAADKALVTELKTIIMNFMNNRKWTNDIFNPQERIKCNIYITIKSMPAYGSFDATASIQCARPVFNSNYESTLLNFFDKRFSFDYNPSQPLDFNENSYFSNLTSMLAFYAYVIIGVDYDSFSKLGGTPYFEKARNIAMVAESYQEGWKQSESTNNRYWLIENFNNQQFLAWREGLYTYHRLAMDKFIDNPEQSRNDILDFLKKTKQPLQAQPYSILIKSFFVAKSGELINVFSGATPEIKKTAVDLLKDLDPLNSERYSAILK